MKVSQRKAQLYGAFLQSIRSVGLETLKETTLFLRNTEQMEAEEKKAA